MEKSIIFALLANKSMLFRIITIWHKLITLILKYNQRRKSNFSYQAFGKNLKKTFENLGPVYIKLGQMLSMRPDFISNEICIELEDLLDSAPPLPFKVIEDILDKPENEAIHRNHLKIIKQPIASASLSQVHKAVLPSGEEVALKILRPKMKQKIQQDLKCLKILTNFFSIFITFKKSLALEMLNELDSWLIQETDYTNEMNNMAYFYKELENNEQIKAPLVYRELSSRTVLAMEYISGYSVLDLIRLKRLNKLPKLSFSMPELVKNIVVNAGINSLKYPYFHADLHPANMIVKDDGTIVLLDFGLIQYFNSRTRKYMALFMLGVVLASPELIISVGKKIATFSENYDEQKVLLKLDRLCNEYRGMPANKMSNGQFMLKIVSLCLENGVNFPWYLLLYTRSALHIDGIVLNLYPEFIFSEYSKKYFLKLYADMTIKEVSSIPHIIEKFEHLLNILRK